MTIICFGFNLATFEQITILEILELGLESLVQLMFNSKHELMPPKIILTVFGLSPLITVIKVYLALLFVVAVEELGRHNLYNYFGIILQLLKGDKFLGVFAVG